MEEAVTEVFSKFLEVILMTLAGAFQGLRQDWNIAEVIALVMLFVALRSGWAPKLQWVGRLETFGSRLAERPALTCGGLFAAAIAIRVILLPVLPEPKPVVSDEFSHLLLADTLLHGRVANPTHPFWEHFESLHIIQQPHYVSNYFPGHAMVLAAARWAFGDPWIGVLMLSGFACAAMWWMLRGFLSAEWALLGGVLTLLRFSIGSYWVNAFHGGFLPAIGGALIAGAYGRLRRRASIGHALVLGLGLAILAATRPFEGLMFSVPFVLALLWNNRASFSNLLRAVVPAVAVASLAVVGLGLYFRAITGSPLVTPYAISQRVYGWPMSLAWANPVERPIRHQELRWYWEYERDEHDKISSPVQLIEYLTMRLQEYWRFFFGPALSLALFAAWRRARARGRNVLHSHVLLPMLGLACALAAILMEGASSPHYIAPATSAMVLIVVLGLRELRTTEQGVVLTRVLPLMLLGVLAMRVGAENVGLPYTQSLNYQSWCCKVRGNDSKARIATELEALPGRHLVIVRAKTDPYNFLQWIYNDAQIDDAKTVWARDMGAQENLGLVEYFRDRDVWLVDPNVEPATLTAVPATAPDLERESATPARHPAEGNTGQPGPDRQNRPSDDRSVPVAGDSGAAPRPESVRVNRPDGHWF